MTGSFWNLGSLDHWTRQASADVTLEIHATADGYLVSIRDRNVVVWSEEVTDGLFPALVTAEKLAAVYMGAEAIA